MATVITAPNSLNEIKNTSLFLAGTIEQGKAFDWQTAIVAAFHDIDVTFLNPRRNQWDSSLEQDISNLVFRQQVEWELDAQERADMILMYFDPSSKSPISLLELGLFAGSGKMVVCCPEGFWRRGNVQVVCERYSIPLYDSLDEMTSAIYSSAKNDFAF